MGSGMGGRMRPDSVTGQRFQNQQNGYGQMPQGGGMMRGQGGPQGGGQDSGQQQNGQY